MSDPKPVVDAAAKADPDAVPDAVSDAAKKTRPTRSRRYRVIRGSIITVGSIVATGVLLVGGFMIYSGMDAPWTFESRVGAVEDRFADGFPQGGVVLTGSSYFEYWDSSAEDLQPIETTNVGIGGTKIGDQMAFVDRLVTPFHPRAVVIYAGSNDINGIPFFSKKGADVAGRVQAYLEDLHAKLPEAELFYVAITDAPVRAGVMDEIHTANADIATFAESTDYVTFIDTAPALLTEDGEIDPTLFRGDSLHFNEAGYDKFASVIQPVLAEALGG